MKREHYEKYWDERVCNDDKILKGFEGCLSRNPSREMMMGFVSLCGAESILDIGCGLALDYKYYMENGLDYLEYHGVDITEGFIQKNKEKYPDADFRVARAQDLPFDDESIDLVSIRAVLEHTPDPDPIIKEMTRVSKKYLMIVWFVPPVADESKEVIKIHNHKNGGQYYRNTYSLKRINNILKKNNLIVIGKEPVVKGKVTHEIWCLEKKD